MEDRDLEFAALLALLRQDASETSWNEIAAKAALARSAKKLLEERNDGGLFDPPHAMRLYEDCLAQVQVWNDLGLQWLTVLDETFPARLLEIRETPPFFFYEGSFHDSDEGMSIVGSRSASDWALEFASEAAYHLVDQGLTVISGLAAGIDTAAHRAALDAGGRTVAFLGTGVDQNYPPANRSLQREIARRGLLLSQFYPHSPPTKKSFPIRNVAMSGYGLATIVVEAKEFSGTRIQARVAGQHGRPVILTKKVTDTTSWGRAISDRPNVYTVSSINDLQSTLKYIREAPARLSSALARLEAV
jgi:DNA processing protein